MSAEQYHQEYNPPVEGSYTGMNKQEKVVPVTDPSNDREQVQQRYVCIIAPQLAVYWSLIVMFDKFCGQWFSLIEAALSLYTSDGYFFGYAFPLFLSRHFRWFSMRFYTRLHTTESPQKGRSRYVVVAGL